MRHWRVSSKKLMLSTREDWLCSWSLKRLCGQSSRPTALRMRCSSSKGTRIWSRSYRCSLEPKRLKRSSKPRKRSRKRVRKAPNRLWEEWKLTKRSLMMKPFARFAATWSKTQSLFRASIKLAKNVSRLICSTLRNVHSATQKLLHWKILLETYSKNQIY